MPGLDALTVRKKLRERDPHIRIVLMSGYDRSSDLGKFGKDVTFLEKPYSRADLIAILDRGQRAAGAIRPVFPFDTIPLCQPPDHSFRNLYPGCGK